VAGLTSIIASGHRGYDRLGQNLNKWSIANRRGRPNADWISYDL
jgi:hypothetical protein